MTLLGEYERTARLAPGFLALGPVSIVLVVVGMDQSPIVSATLSVISLAGGPILLAEMVRRRGTNIQKKLWKIGAPTTRKLRLTEVDQNSAQREVWRRAVEKVANIKLVSRTVERRQPKVADAQIEVGVGVVREKTRDKLKFPLVWAENKAYGFHRNLYGIRWIGRGIAFVSVSLMMIFILWQSSTASSEALSLTNIMGATICVVWLIMWFVIPTRKRVEEAADKYAYQLLQAANTIAG
jgi:hypothetical protein